MIKFFTFLTYSIFGIIALLVLLIVGLWAFHTITIIDNTIDNGEGYGFNIGDSKVDSYKKLKKLIETNEVVGFGYMYPKEVYSHFYSPQEIYKVKNDFHRWSYWIITGVEKLQANRIDLDFENGELNEIRNVGDGSFVSLSHWPESSFSNIDVLNIGDSYSSAYQKLEAIYKSYPLVRVGAAGFDSYKLPKLASKDEYYLVKDFNRWNLRVSPRFFSNSITLSFDEDGKLIEIYRNRYYLEFP
ncbi:hypothetical protein [Paraglaciecola sp.]|uniref:hypothetical protein n=1 Tax=Paraglaciecola sp. TaxID=1920173 RepID=UPI0030F4988B